MNSFWSSLYDKFKDRHYAGLFFISFGSVFGLFILVMILCQIIGTAHLQQYFLQMLPGAGLLVLALVWRGIRRARTQRRKRFRREELSRDEIRKARSKLVNQNKT